MAKYDIGSALSGAGAGAASGATLGSIFPGIGTGIGAGVGGIAGGLAGLFNRQGKPQRISTFDKNQKRLYDNYSQGIQGQGPMTGDFTFDPNQLSSLFQQSVANPAYQNFQENIIPGITGQFRGGNLQNSSYLGNALGRAGTDLQKNLDSKLAELLYQGQQDAIQRRLGSLRDILGTQTFAYNKPQPSPLDAILGGFSQGVGGYAGKYLTS